MDRGYESFNNIALSQEKERNFIIRAKESYGMITNYIISAAFGRPHLKSIPENEKNYKISKNHFKGAGKILVPLASNLTAYRQA